MAKLHYIDLFAGCGGLSLGFYQAGLAGVFAIEKDRMAFETLKTNLIDKVDHFDWPTWLPIKEHDINAVIEEHEKELKSLHEKIDIVGGGPPCQGFSFAGRRQENDVRNRLVDSYLKFIELVRPRAVFLENVRGFTVGFENGNGRGEPKSDYVEKRLRRLNYNTSSMLVNFSDFGIPQKRTRFVLAGFLDIDSKDFFKRLYSKRAEFIKRKGIKDINTTWDAISDLESNRLKLGTGSFEYGAYSRPKSPYQKLMRIGSSGTYPDSHRFARHGDKVVRNFKYILNHSDKNKAASVQIRNALGLKKRSIAPLDPFMSCPTLTTLPDDYIHYSEPRILTVREYARIQSFPDWFEFRGKYTTGGKRRRLEVPRYSQVGNAIPPLFMEQAGKIMRAMLS
ncbi:DNA cytosine methyltransferase [Candidatus Parvarchaeota archaeon]|nr:DNA cytosine methyltransferase [Candidatus Parvarchaeota archaeon]